MRLGTLPTVGYLAIGGALGLGCGAASSAENHLPPDSPGHFHGDLIESAHWFPACPRVGFKPAESERQYIPDARRFMAQGLKAMERKPQPSLDEAYQAFKRAYELSGGYNPLRLAASCAMQLEHDGWAIEAYLYLKRIRPDHVDSDEWQQSWKNLKQLNQRVAWVTLSSSAPPTEIIDRRFPVHGQPVERRYVLGKKCERQINIRAGDHEFTATSPGHSPKRWRHSVRPGQKIKHRFEF